MFTYKQILDSLPKAKNKKSSLWVKVCARKLSFPLTYAFINLGFSANAVSMLSVAVALIGAVFMMIDSLTCRIIGTVIINLWLVLDCVDGNIARCKKEKTKMGSYIDAICGYSVIAFSYLSIGVAAFHTNGVFLKQGMVLTVILGGFASILDIYARLIYQRYLVALTENKIPIDDEKEYSKDNKSLKARINFLRVRIGKELGISGLFMPALIVSTIFSTYDIMIIFYFLFNAAAFAASFLLYSKRGMDMDKK